MQTFLPYEDFKESLECLDNKRLGKQRSETRTVIKAIRGECKGGWIHTPLVKMWRDYELALIHYYNLSLIVWASRGFKNSILQPIDINESKIMYPWWNSLKQFHDSHKSRLLAKNHDFYKKYNWQDIPVDIDYFWPTKHLHLKDTI